MGTTAAPARDRWRRGPRAASVITLGAALLAPVALAASTTSASASVTAPIAAPGGTQMSASTRKTSAPNVSYPVPSSSGPKDLRTFRPGGHRGTEILATCNSTIRSLNPGTVELIDSPYSGGRMVAVATTKGRLTSYYAFMNKVSVNNGQIVSAGQALGLVGDQGAAKGCMLHVEVRLAGRDKPTDPTAWLEKYVGQPVPDNTIFGSSGFRLASINTLGKSHTVSGGDAPGYPSYTTRTPKLLDYIKTHKLGVIGLQEFQKPQYSLFRAKAGSRYALYPPSTSYDTENSIAWDTTKFSLVHGYLKSIPYFNGATRKMPYVLLERRATGKTAWFINVHNPADTYQFHNQGQYRAEAVAIEKSMIISLRQHNRPVFLTGDMNDRTDVFCQITAGKLAISANSVPSTTCAPPADPWIDWIFGAGQTRFSIYTRDWSTKDAKITDHPAIWSKTYLAG